MFVSDGKGSESFYRGGTLVVWFYYDESKFTFYGHDLGGYPGSSEYEYWLHVTVSALRRALHGGAHDDIGELVCKHSEEIMSVGEMTWLKRHGVPFEFNSRIETD